jgi:hypothetical protein
MNLFPPAPRNVCRPIEFYHLARPRKVNIGGHIENLRPAYLRKPLSPAAIWHFPINLHGRNERPASIHGTHNVRVMSSRSQCQATFVRVG